MVYTVFNTSFEGTICSELWHFCVASSRGQRWLQWLPGSSVAFLPALGRHPRARQQKGRNVLVERWMRPSLPWVVRLCSGVGKCAWVSPHLPAMHVGSSQPLWAMSSVSLALFNKILKPVVVKVLISRYSSVTLLLLLHEPFEILAKARLLPLNLKPAGTSFMCT